MNIKNYNTILLIDDDEDDCYLFKEAVAEVSNSLEVKYIHGADHLSQILENTKPSIIFIDLHLPKLNGPEYLRLIRSYPGFQNIPVIFWSGFSNARDINAVYLEGASYYFEKPYTLNDLVAELNKILNAIKILPRHEHASNLNKNINCGVM